MPDVRWMGDGAVRLKLPSGVSPSAALRALRGVAGVDDLVATDASICAYGDALESSALVAALARASHGIDALAQTSHRIRVRYDGPDLVAVAHATGLDVSEVTRRHFDATYRVAFLGFAPGFAYLDGLDPALALARRSTPRTQVAENAVAIAGMRTAIYPSPTAGGWHWIGTALDVVLFDARSGARFAAGDFVQFVAE